MRADTGLLDGWRVRSSMPKEGFRPIARPILATGEFFGHSSELGLGELFDSSMTCDGDRIGMPFVSSRSKRRNELLAYT